MAISNQIGLVATALWPQGDIRDPLGVWGARTIVTGDASAGSIRVQIQAPEAIAGAFVYTCYSALIANLEQAATTLIKIRLLTNWPDIDPVNVGVQGYNAAFVTTLNGDADFAAGSAPTQALVQPSDRFILLFDPRPVVGAFDIVELEIGNNVLNIDIAFEAWGYYWDRSVLNAPGGLRHPGSS